MTAARTRALTASVAVLPLLAILLRAYCLSQPVVTFHATRHYRSALLARACYYDHAAQIPQPATAVAHANREMQPAGELPLMEWLACGAYLVSGRENVMIPRALASVAWVAGAVALAWLALGGLRRANAAAALIKPTSVFLTIPVRLGLSVSRHHPRAGPDAPAICS